MANAAHQLFFHPFNQEKANVLYFLSHPPKHLPLMHNGTRQAQDLKQRVPARSVDTPLPFGTKVLNAAPHALSSSGLWAKRAREEPAPLCSISGSPLLAALTACPCPAARGPCQPQRACPHLLPAPPARSSCPQRVSSRERPP